MQLLLILYVMFKASIQNFLVCDIVHSFHSYFINLE
jgi:hypothetical protein